jgi:transcriptional regulator with PAS, ATPase and Fis domain
MSKWLDPSRQYNETDYEGCFNINAAVKRLILRAEKRHFGNKLAMAKALGVSKTHLMRLIYQHSLYDI